MVSKAKADTHLKILSASQVDLNLIQALENKRNFPSSSKSSLLDGKLKVIADQLQSFSSENFSSSFTLKKVLNLRKKILENDSLELADHLEKEKSRHESLNQVNADSESQLNSSEKNLQSLKNKFENVKNRVLARHFYVLFI
jgi:hypothetical protein